MTREAIEYFKFHRKIFCEDYLKICPKDSIAYQATLKEKEFYDMAIKALEQEPRKGHWIDGHCSECGCDVPAYIVDWKWQKDMDAKFCPNCGADMREVEK